jgi:transcription elongation GreA/GreB family factor
VSKAFTTEEDAGLETSTAPRRRDPVRLTRLGARLLADRLGAMDASDPAASRIRDLLETAQVASPNVQEAAGFGARVRFRDAQGRERAVVLVSSDEVGFVPDGVSMGTPLAQALVGVRTGDVVEVDQPREDELTVLGVDWPV